MTLKDIAAIAGKPGLYKILKPTRNGMIVEAMVGKPNKFVVGTNHRVSVLKEISIYTTGEEESVPLFDVFSTIKEKHGDQVEVDTKSSESLFGFMEEILPDYDTERVYNSDIKKLISWFNLLSKEAPDVFEKEEEEKAVEESETKTKETSEKETKVEEPSKEKAPKKAAKKPAAKKSE
ncbi:DUF5606 domain-containing protein [Flexithrix dorotheae]|uniref:DUF5606 family protein n=1 Tax=Flexithrix dorotheae TaxID=70993 RepID=UPI00037EC991|nr:DUF5606 domain-containing protein [Flexithrix dorotheae]